jgi:hypothetical protein
MGSFMAKGCTWNLKDKPSKSSPNWTDGHNWIKNDSHERRAANYFGVLAVFGEPSNKHMPPPAASRTGGSSISLQRGGEPMGKILESLQNTVIAGIVLTVIVAIILVAVGS